MKSLDWVLCICYYVQVWKDKNKNVLAFLDSENKVNTMTPAYAAQLGLKVQKINVGSPKIERSLLETYSMVIAAF